MAIFNHCYPQYLSSCSFCLSCVRTHLQLWDAVASQLGQDSRQVRSSPWATRSMLQARTSRAGSEAEVRRAVRQKQCKSKYAAAHGPLGRCCRHAEVRQIVRQKVRQKLGKN
eukprot:1156492-Pelagomonas_calceolata.AAC.5